MSKLITIERIGPSTAKLHGYTIDIPDGPAYHVISYKSLDSKETQKSIDMRFVRLVNKLIDDEKI